MNTLVVACHTIADELNMAMSECNCSYPILWIESGLHLYPNSLKNRIQEELNHISNVEQVILAFGYCGNSIIGLTAPSYRLIIPRVDDCITLILGSSERRNEVSKEMGTYFVTKGWIDNEKSIWEEYQASVKRYGKSRADRIYKTLLQHYRRLGVIRTGAYKLEDYLEKTKMMAKELNLQHEIIPGTLSYLKKLLKGPWDDDFIVVEPGETIDMNHIFKSKKSAVEII